MTSPDKSIPPGAYVGSKGASNGLSRLQKVTWQSAQQSIISNVTQSFQNVGNASTDINSTTSRALDAANSAQNGANTAQSAATAAQNTSTANASIIAVIQNQQTQTQVGGASFADGFQTWDTTKWNTIKWGSSPDIVAIDNQAGLAKSASTGDGAVFALWKTPLMTDSQSVSIVLGRPNQSGQYSGSGILIRAAADFSSFVIVQVGRTSIYLQRGSYVGGTLSITSWVVADNLSAINTGDTVTVNANGPAYEVLVNGIGRVSYRDTVVSSPVGANNRLVGLFCGYHVSTGWGGGVYYGYDLDSIAAADTAAPAVVGTGWALYRQNPAAVAQVAGSQRYGSVFDTIRVANNANVLDLGRGQIQITKSGWYVMSVGVNWSAACGTGYNYNVALWTAPSPTGQWSEFRIGGETEGSTVHRVAGTYVVFAGAGSVWAPGYYIAGPNDMLGDSSGRATYFEGTLCSFS
ncbi:hypothetical protein DFR70_104447 [Nocardia tenerifensis]|uniref:Uncharacterized protein n=1 Tax=Nocardia tenerifensis TaxID=228006 RepID=A0A318KFN9_9NOCA|nr:hypothetical protein [Nocardia tenerifensis]PXX65383.1 hypothetical protein DFR70_104447 [Nocardia tenerifensis]